MNITGFVRVCAGILPGLCWVYARLCSEIVLALFGAALGLLGRTRTTSEQSQQQSRRNHRTIWERYRTVSEQSFFLIAEFALVIHCGGAVFLLNFVRKVFGKASGQH